MKRLEVITLPKAYSTDVLSQDQIEFVAKRLPCPNAQTGRPAYSNIELLPGILKVLRSGSRWRDLDDKRCPSAVTHWRRLRYWQKLGGFLDLWQYLLKLLLKKGKLKLKTASIDGTLIQSFAFKELTQYSGHYHKTGTKVSLVVDRLGIPLSHVLAMGAQADISLAIPTIENIPKDFLSEIKKLLGDKGYVSTHLAAFLHSLGIKDDIPDKALPIFWKTKLLFKNLEALKAHQARDQTENTKSNRNRFVIERTNAWTKSFRRLRFRFDYTILSFTALLNLALVVICVRKLIN